MPKASKIGMKATTIPITRPATTIAVRGRRRFTLDERKNASTPTAITTPMTTMRRTYSPGFTWSTLPTHPRESATRMIRSATKYNRDGQLGNGTRDNGWTPAEVSGLDRIVAVAAGVASFGGNCFSGALRDDGTVWTWGSGVSGVMGNGTRNPSPDDPGGRNLLPAQVPGLANVKAISLGYGHVAALLGDGTLRMWGHDGFGQLGVGPGSDYYPKPVMPKGITNVAAIYLGSMRTLAVRTDGSLWIWGSGSSGGQGVVGKNLRVPTLLELP